MPTANKVLIYRWFEEVWNKKRESAITEMLHPDAMIFGLAETPVRGIEGFLPFWRKLVLAFPNMTIAVESALAEEDKVAARCSVRAKHTGPGFGEPTNNSVSFTGMVLVHVKDGRMIEGWNNFDFLSFYQQLGVLPRLST